MQDAKNIICNIVICPHQMHLVVSSVKNYILCIFKKKTKTQPTKKKSSISASAKEYILRFFCPSQIGNLTKAPKRLDLTSLIQ